MAVKQDKGFVRNVARDRTYQNQNEEYDEEYFKWCADETNPYSFNFVQDTREHSYKAGRGFIKRGADTAEQGALHNCLRLLGGTMLIMLLFDVINYLLTFLLNDGQPCNAVYYSHRGSIGNASVAACILCSAVNTMKYAAAIFIYHVRIRLPKKVALPRGNTSGSFKLNAVIIMLTIAVAGRLSSSLLSYILGYVNVDSTYIYMFDSTRISAQVISLIYNCIVIPALCEILFRGLVLQSFRQFGDAFAVIVSAFACGISFCDVSYVGYAILCSLVIGVFTVRSGSIAMAIVMHSVSSTINYLLVFVNSMSAGAGRILSYSIYMVICAGMLVTYTTLSKKINRSFNIDQHGSELSLPKKIELMLSSNTVVIWLVCAIVMTILTMRFL